MLSEEKKKESNELYKEMVGSEAKKSMGEHHAHHHHHHHSHKKGKSSLKKEFVKFIKEHSLAFKGAAVAILVVAAINVLVGVIENALVNEEMASNPENSQTEQTEKVDFDDEFIYVGLPTLEKEIFVSNRAVINYMNSDPKVPISALVDFEADTRYDAEAPVVLKFDLSKISNGFYMLYSTVEVSENSDFENARLFEVEDDFSVTINHLKTGTEYYYRLSVYFSGNKKIDYCGTFKTAETPRILSIDGIYNVRDIGGWKTEDGKVIKQGLLYRGTELDGAVEPAYKLSKKGFEDMVSVLGIRTDMDLRASTDSVPGTYILGANVEHIYYGALMYGAIETEEGKTAVKAVFSDLAKQEKYPVYLHCTYGMDRTGTVCYLLEAILGLSEENLIREYELSGLFSGETNRENLNSIKAVLDGYEGKTINEKAESYLLSAGVTAEEIASIRNIFLGD